MAQPLQPLLVGYYGEHNLGDDALLEVLLSQLPPDCRPTVTAHDQELVAQRFGLACVDRRQLGAVLAALGGNRLLSPKSCKPGGSSPGSSSPGKLQHRRPKPWQLRP